MAEKSPESREQIDGGNLSSFTDTGIFHIDGSRVVFVDPVRVLNSSYSRFRVSPSRYYSRSFESLTNGKSTEEAEVVTKRKRKKRKKGPRELNEREMAAENRHQEVRPLLHKAHKSLLATSSLLSFLPMLVKYEDNCHDEEMPENNFVELGSLSQMQQYEISLCYGAGDKKATGSQINQHGEREIVPLFNNLITNETAEDLEAEFLSSKYILPLRSCFYISDLLKVRDLIPARSDLGYNLIVIDPPWENGSVYQKAVYPTLPNRHFLYLPVKQLAHEEGALVVLWMTNREKFHSFVENELFPAWGITDVTTHYWLKVKPDGSLIGELDLFHHRPYESFMIGYVNVKNYESKIPISYTYMKESRVFISVPGSHSRKPPLGKLLLNHIPGPKPAKCIELFARELITGWTSWGNEPLHFQDSRYFIECNQ